MIQIEIENIKKITDELFLGEAFDEFLACEASFSTFVNVMIDGRINTEFEMQGEKAESEPRERETAWKRIKHLCRETVKGSRTPLAFKIVLKSPRREIEKFLKAEGINMNPENVNALFLNFRFKEGSLKCVTGTSLAEFTADRSLDEAWDRKVSAFISYLQRK